MRFPKFLIIAAVLVFFPTAFVAAGAIADTGTSFYVSADGNDTNNGFSERTAFKTLAKAIECASSDSVKRIVVIGALNSESEFFDTESEEGKESVFNINNSGNAEILITGKPGENAVLQGGDGRRVISILGTSRIRFENILITGGSTWKQGGGIYGREANITLAQGTVLSGNLSSEGGGVFVLSGSLTMLENAAIRANSVLTDEGGGAVVYSGSFTMRDNSQVRGNYGGGLIFKYCEVIIGDNAAIMDNQCEYYGGGVMILSSAFTMSGNSKISGNLAGAGGGGIRARHGSLTFFGDAAITGNKTSGKGGGISLDSCSVTVRGDARISANVSGDDGGGIYSQGGYLVLDEFARLLDNEAMCGGGFCIEGFASAIVRGNTLVSGNSAFGGYQGGGGICAGYNSSIHMTGGKVIKNVSSQGGGVYIESGVFIFDDGYIAENRAEIRGGGIHGSLGRLIINAESEVENNFPDNIMGAGYGK